MPANDTSPAALTPAQLTSRLTALIHGPHDDTSTAAAADLAAETVRYLNYAASKGGITDPATIAIVTSNLAIAAYRLPQLLDAVSRWLNAENDAGRIADDPRRSPAQLTNRIRAALNQAADSAAALAADLSSVHNLTATLHADGPAAPAA